MSFLSYINRFKNKAISFLCIGAVCSGMFNAATVYADNVPEGEQGSGTGSPYITAENWPDAPEISANAAILINVNTGTILYDKNCDERKYPASMTKVMTALLTIENNSLNDVITYTDDAVFNLEDGASYLALNYGEQLTVEQSLYGLLLASANDVANGLAVYTAGSMDGFVNMMNERAAQIGCTNTHFANPNGLHDDNHYTTCHDMALIMMEAIKNNTFLTIDSTEYYEIPPTNMQPQSRPLRMLHKMMNPSDQYYYKYCVAGKTGYTDQAGTTLVTYCKKDDMELVSVIMDSYFTQYDDTIALMNYGFDNFSLYNMADQDLSAGKENKSSSLLSSVLPSSSSFITVDKDTYIILPANESIDAVSTDISYDNTENSSGSSIADITYYYNGMKIGNALLKFSTGEITTAFEYDNIQKLPEEGEDIFSSGDKIVITYRKFLAVLAMAAVILVFIIMMIIHFSPRNVRRRRSERKRRIRLRHKYYD